MGQDCSREFSFEQATETKKLKIKHFINEQEQKSKVSRSVSHFLRTKGTKKHQFHETYHRTYSADQKACSKSSRQSLCLIMTKLCFSAPVTASLS